ncbi:hypothetical protein [Tepidimonas ignava]|uniref:hypothetical protein n=1 Tax=Tepidimonas ignava TaxID=114249 RepID=UPI00105155E2|nr:hypothetical protein [Tepidimonas ignava]
MHEIWQIALGSLVPTLIALIAGKALAGKGAIFPVLPAEKLTFFALTWLFVSAVAVGTYLLTSMLGLDEANQTTIAGFLVPMFAGAVFVRNRLS